jgi:CheY-like chemotaxis protein
MQNEQQRRVLIVDDDPAVRHQLSVALRERPVVVHEACDGLQALELIRENTYSVMLLDLMMPVADGFCVLDALGRDQTDPPIVLVVTGADRGTIARLDPNRIHGVIRKPFDPQEIAGVVAACTEIRSRSAFETMALATMISSAPLIALLKL